jgi:hypothetical protein
MMPMKLKLVTTVGLTLLAISAYGQGPAGSGAGTKEAPKPASQQGTTEQTPAAPARQCLIVTSAEGHRFRNSMIAGALTGGIGFVAGAAFSGGRYEYRDSINMQPSEVKMKYKGPELQKLQQNGIHVVVVDKKDKTGEEVKAARASCQE